MNSPKYMMYATVLDAFQNYLNSDTLWYQFYGSSDNPKYSIEEYETKSFKELIDRINRVQFESESADKGSAFNEVIDCLIEKRKSDKMEIVSDKSQGIILATYKSRNFVFDLKLCLEFSEYFKGALTQQRTESIISTAYGDVLLYGYIDELMPLSVHDIKTTHQYKSFKFRDHYQHLVYPYCLIKNGNDIKLFEYNITDFKNTYTETYAFVYERDVPILTQHCEKLIEFLERNKELITDKKIFGIIE